MTESCRENKQPGAAGQDDRRLNVLVVSHMYPADASDHAGIFVREQVEALAVEADVTVVVGRMGATLSRQSGHDGNPMLAEVELPWHRWQPSPLRVAWLVPRYYREALRVARGTKRPFDVVHAHYGFPDGVVGVMLGRALGVPVVVTMHGSDYSHQLARPVVGGIIGRWLARADLIIGVSPHIVQGVRAMLGLPEERVLYLPNGYDARQIRVHADRAPKHLLFVGSLIPRKNPDVLLEAYALIASETEFDLVLAGDGPMMDGLKRQARQLGIESRVVFRGQVQRVDVDGLLADAAMLVLPSKSEGMPIVVNEALASGTPVVATRLPGIEQQVWSEDFGILVPVGDVVALSEALLEMAQATPDYGRIATECKVVSWSAYARRLIDLYRSLQRRVAPVGGAR